MVCEYRCDLGTHAHALFRRVRSASQSMAVEKILDTIVGVFVAYLTYQVLFANVARFDAKAVGEGIGEFYGGIFAAMYKTAVGPFLAYDVSVQCMKQLDPVECMETWRRLANYTS